MNKKIVSLAATVPVLAGSVSQVFAAPPQQNEFGALYADAMKEGKTFPHEIGACPHDNGNSSRYRRSSFSRHNR